MKRGNFNHQGLEMSGLLARGSRFEGEISFDGLFRIDGAVKGLITSQTDKPSMLVISEEAIVEADIIADVVIISGQVLGNILAQDRIELNAPGRLEGNIFTFDLVIDDEALFQGQCTMLRHLQRSERRVLKYSGLSGIDPKMIAMPQKSIIDH